MFHSWHVIHVFTQSASVGTGRVFVDVSLLVKTLTLVVTGTTDDSDRLNRNLSSICTFQKLLPNSRLLRPSSTDCREDKPGSESS